MKRAKAGRAEPAAPRSAPPTIADIARLAGVSKTTVSLIVNGKARSVGISPRTEKRVLSLVKQRGYVANRFARGLRSRGTQTIGFVAPDFVNPFFARLNQSLEDVTRGCGHQLLVACSQADARLEVELVARLVSHRIDGLIVASVVGERALRERARSVPVPVVYVDREVTSGNSSSVSSENEVAAHAAVAHLLGAGAREVAYLGGHRVFSTWRDRFAGYVRALAERGIELDRRLVVHGGWTPEDGRQMMRGVCERRDGVPEAIFTASYTILEGALRAIVERLGALPGHVRIATFDDHPLLDFLPGRITSVRQDTQRLASEALAMILRAGEGGGRVEHRRVPAALVVR